MFDFLNRKKLVLEIYDKSGSYMDIKHIRPNFSYHFIPEWFKQARGSLDFFGPNLIKLKKSTIKLCPAIQHSLNTGIIIPMFCDLSIKVQPDGYVDFFSPKDQVHLSRHDDDEFQGFPLKEGHIHLKMTSPWFFSSNKHINYMFMPVLNKSFFNNDVVFVSGIIDFTYNNATNINFLLKLKKDPYQIDFKAGDPLIQIIPLSEQKLNIDYCDISKNSKFFNSSRYGKPLKFYKNYSFLKNEN